MPLALARLRKRRSDAATRADAKTLRLYYASDVHGSEQCWRKFLRAAEFYKADALIMGGDIAGKAIVPIELEADGRFRGDFLGEQHSGGTETELEEFKVAIRYNGFYPYAAPEAELATYRGSAEARDSLFERVMVEEARRWMDLATQRTRESGVPIYVVPGNDDPWAFDEVLREADALFTGEDGVAEVGDHEMISCSYANPTPWHSPRELSEEDLFQRLHGLAEQLQRPETAIFNLHVPPYNSGLDTACKVTEDLTFVMKGGSPVEAPVGSHAVRQVIEEYQPLLALHGHIHESRRTARIGRTVCINPGSEYNTGRIHGALVTIGAQKVLSHQFVVG